MSGSHSMDGHGPVATVSEAQGRGHASLERVLPPMASAYDFLRNQYVYIIVSARARGLSVGVNLNPERRCNFDCLYCEVPRPLPGGNVPVDVEVMAREVEQTLEYVQSERLRQHPVLGTLPREFVQFRHVSLSGLGEPTLCPNFVDVVQTLAHLRVLGRRPYFHLVLVTNGSQLDQPNVQSGLKYFMASDEIWIKLDAGTPEYFLQINRTPVAYDKILHNILLIGRQRPVVIQSLFVAVDGEEPPARQIEQYAQRLKELKQAGAQIALVQIYSATRPTHQPACSHLPLKSLSRIAQIVRCATELPVEVF
ncbi:MAG: radical SAM protein [Verrucomicrobiae bacterium]|nr:radical SAM protein [Verrucomicrobiae bacterium]